MTRRAAATQPAHTAAWSALGSSVVLRVCDPGGLQPACAAVARELDRVDRACSRFRDDSELARVNAAAGRPTPVSPLLFEALALAQRAAELTDGAVEPTLGRALEVVGYDRDWSLIDDDPGPGHAPVAVEIRRRAPRLELDRSTRSVRLSAGAALDLGATAKAWAADRAAVVAAAAAGCGALVSLGGDIATAGAGPPSGWAIRVTDDHRAGAEAPGQTVTITGGGLATSSTAVRSWKRAGEQVHHILDPATGSPARGPWRTVSVTAATCADANIAATASIVRGDGAERWLERRRMPARLVDGAGRVTVVAGWPADVPARSAA